MAKGAKTGGRVPGSINKKTKDTQEKIEASGLTPLDYMLMVMRDAGQDEQRRLAAANMAAPYVHAKLSSVELSGKDGTSLFGDLLKSIDGSALGVVKDGK